MVKIKIKNDLDEISIDGHAMYDDFGKDIVCASISSIVITSVNAIIRLEPNSIDYQLDDGVFIKVLKHNDIVDNLIKNMIDLLSDLEKQYPKYIEIRRC